MQAIWYFERCHFVTKLCGLEPNPKKLMVGIFFQIKLYCTFSALTESNSLRSGSINFSLFSSIIAILLSSNAFENITLQSSRVFKNEFLFSSTALANSSWKFRILHTNLNSKIFIYISLPFILYNLDHNSLSISFLVLISLTK